MLRIKKERIQDLEKFGFKYIKEVNREDDYLNSRYTRDFIEIDGEDGAFEYIANSDRANDLLFDLIQAGMVEKAE